MKKVKKIINMLSIMCILFFTQQLFAATNISVSSKTVYPGDIFSVNINVSNIATWQLKVKYSGNIELVSGSTSLVRGDDGIDNITTTAGVLKFKATAVGNATITVEGNSYNKDRVKKDVNSSSSILISEKPVVTPPNINQGGGTSGNTSGQTKSSNNYLKSLQLDVDGMTPRFVKTKTNYSISVGKNVSKINVTAKAEDSKSKVTWYGNTDLKDGDNKITVQVTAEDGSKRYYIVNVNKSADPEKSNAYLANLAVNGVELTPEFQAEVFEYNIGTIKGDVKSLDILCPTQNPDAKVEISGNEQLVEGQNTVKIKVTSVDGNTTKEYIINFEKEVINEEISDPLMSEETQNNNDDMKDEGFLSSITRKAKQNWLILLMYAFILLELIQIIYLYLKLNKTKETSKEVKKDNTSNIEKQIDQGKSTSKRRNRGEIFEVKSNNDTENEEK